MRKIDDWTELKKDQFLKTEKLDDNALFCLLIYNLSHFISKEQSQQNAFKRKYHNDYVFFEVGCYLFFRMDVWLITEKPTERYKLTKSLIDQYVELFNSLYPNIDFAGLFNNRMIHYAAFIQKGESVEKYHIHLGHLIKNSADGNLEIYHDPHDVPFSLSTSLMEEMELKINIISYEKCLLPLAFDAFERYFNH